MSLPFATMRLRNEPRRVTCNEQKMFHAEASFPSGHTTVSDNHYPGHVHTWICSGDRRHERNGSPVFERDAVAKTPNPELAAKVELFVQSDGNSSPATKGRFDSVRRQDSGAVACRRCLGVARHTVELAYRRRIASRRQPDCLHNQRQVGGLGCRYET